MPMVTSSDDAFDDGSNPNAKHNREANKSFQETHGVAKLAEIQRASERKSNGVNGLMGDVLVFGSGEMEQLGFGDNVYEKKKPALLKSLNDRSKGIVEVCCGGLHTLVLTKNGDIYSWGCGDDGALGRETKGGLV